MSHDIDPYYTWLGIPPKDQPPNHYRLLGVELFESDLDVIENAADRQMAHVRTVGSARHQDLSQRLLNELAAARLVLLNAEKKAAYDAALKAATAPQQRGVRATRSTHAAPNVDSPPMPPQQPTALPQPQVPPQQPIAPHQQFAPQQLSQPPASSGEGFTPPGLIVQPLYPPGNASPADHAAQELNRGYALTPQLPRTSSSAPTAAPNYPLLLTIGGLLGAVLLGGAWFFLRDRAEPQRVVDQKPATAIDPSGEKTPPESKSNSKTTEPPETKTTFNPKGSEKKPPAVEFRREEALVLLGRDYVEVTKTVEQVDKPYTAEMWVRIDPAKPRCYLMGNAAISDTLPGVPPGPAVGWALSHVKGLQVDGKELTGLYLQTAGKWYSGGSSSAIRDAEWHHVAIVWEPSGADVAFRCYLDGRSVQSIRVTNNQYVKSPANLCLGCPRYLPDSDVTQTSLTLGTFRLSDASRYSSDFSPTIEWNGDPSTVAWLDCTPNLRDSIPDLAGHEHAGRITGGRWAPSGRIAGSLVVASKMPRINELPKYALQFTEQARVELDNSRALFEGLTAYTVEAWIKPARHETAQGFLGNLAVAKNYPEIRDGRDAGFLLSMRYPPDAKLAFFVLRGEQGRGSSIDGTNPGDWLHVAAVFERDLESFYVNGQRGWRSKQPLPIPSVADLCLGLPPKCGSVDQMRFEGSIAGLRISEGTRYTDRTFTPAARFTSDKDTLVLLDFDGKRDGSIVDISGKNHHGRLHGEVKWVDLASAGTTPTTPTPTPTPEKKSQPPIVVSTPKEKPPTAEEQAKCLTEIQATFAAAFAKAKTPDTKRELAEFLLKQSAQGDLDANTRFTMLHEARTIAADLATIDLARTAGEEILTRYTISPGAQWSDTLTRASKAAKTPEVRRELALACFEPAAQAFRAEDFAASESILTQAATLGQRDLTLAKRARDLAKQATTAKDRFTQVKEVMANATPATETSARVIVGKYLCFVRDDWKNGIGNLGMGGDDTAAKLARDDEKNPSDAKAQESLADAWAAFAKTAPAGFDREGANRRALYWLVKAHRGSTGLAKTRIGQRLEEATSKAAQTDSMIGGAPWLGEEGSEHSWDAHQGGFFHAIAVSRDGTLIASVPSNGVVKLWHIASGRQLRELNSQNVRRLDFSPDGKWILTQGSQGTVNVWDVATGKELHSMEATAAESPFWQDMEVSRDGQIVIGACTNNRGAAFVDIWDIKTGRRLRRVLVDAEGAQAVALSPDNRWLAMCVTQRRGRSDETELRIVDAQSGKIAAKGQSTTGYVHDLAYSPSGRAVAVAGSVTSIWNTADGKQIARLRTADVVSIAADGRRFLLAGSNSFTPDLFAFSGQKIATLGRVKTGNSNVRAKLTSDGRAMVVGTSEGELHVTRLPD